MAHNIFFSWQADRLPVCGRNFIERALEKALGRLASETELEEAVREGLELDRDTKGVAGQPPIVDTIFKKIDGAAVFVPDLTFVGNRADGRPTPNPNVLIEYGWALKSLSHGRIVPIMNTAHGMPTAENMPFDMRHLRNPICYDLPDGADETARKAEREKLVGTLAGAIGAVLDSDDFKSSLPKLPPPPPFPAKSSGEGGGRFRLKGARLGLLCEPGFGTTEEEIRLRDGPCVWLRVMPSSDGSYRFSSPVLQKAARNPAIPLLTITTGTGSWSFLRDADGIGMFPPHSPDRSVTGSVTFAFSTGEVWAVDTYGLTPVVGTPNVIPSNEENLAVALRRYASFLGLLGIAPPYKWIAGIEGVAGRSILMPMQADQTLTVGPRGRCLTDAFEETGSFDPSEGAGEVLLPFFKRIYEECGLERPSFLRVPA